MQFCWAHGLDYSAFTPFPPAIAVLDPWMFSLFEDHGMFVIGHDGCVDDSKRQLTYNISLQMGVFIKTQGGRMKSCKEVARQDFKLIRMRSLHYTNTHLLSLSNMQPLNCAIHARNYVFLHSWSDVCRGQSLNILPWSAWSEQRATSRDAR